MTRTFATIAAIAALAVVMAVFLAATTIGQDMDPEFGDGTYRDIEAALTGAGLDANGGPTGDADIVGGYEKVAYDVYSPKGDGLVIVRAFSGPEQLDEINDESYVGDAAVGYRWQQFLVTITGGSDPAAIDLFRVAMTELGADEVFDLL
jgi:hypothetical protein